LLTVSIVAGAPRLLRANQRPAFGDRRGILL